MRTFLVSSLAPFHDARRYTSRSRTPLVHSLSGVYGSHDRLYGNVVLHFPSELRNVFVGPYNVFVPLVAVGNHSFYHLFELRETHNRRLWTVYFVQRVVGRRTIKRHFRLPWLAQKIVRVSRAFMRNPRHKTPRHEFRHTISVHIFSSHKGVNKSRDEHLLPRRCAEVYELRNGILAHGTSDDRARGTAHVHTRNLHLHRLVRIIFLLSTLS
jgi:hypothetical protein